MTDFSLKYVNEKNSISHVGQDHGLLTIIMF